MYFCLHTTIRPHSTQLTSFDPAYLILPRSDKETGPFRMGVHCVNIWPNKITRTGSYWRPLTEVCGVNDPLKRESLCLYPQRSETSKDAIDSTLNLPPNASGIKAVALRRGKNECRVFNKGSARKNNTPKNLITDMFLVLNQLKRGAEWSGPEQTERVPWDVGKAENLDGGD